jgi:hypothetical protein
MPRFHFHLRARGTIHRDLDGTELPDLAAAHDHAAAVAEELMRHSSGGTRHWSMCVEDQSGKLQFDLFFADVDPRVKPIRLVLCPEQAHCSMITDNRPVAGAGDRETDCAPAWKEGRNGHPTVVAGRKLALGRRRYP